MSEPENFLARWSRRKQEAEQTSEESQAAEGAGDEKAAEASPPALAQLEVRPEADAEIDLADLPPIDSIGPETDIRAFLRSGVPAELARAALRRVWTADPAIRDFIGIAENQWDFATGNGIPGFGPLEAADNVGRMVAQITGEGFKSIAPETGPAPSQQGSAINQVTLEPRDSDAMKSSLQTEELSASRQVHPHLDPKETVGSADIVRCEEDDFASQQDSSDGEDDRQAGRRGHGGALPQ